MWRSSGRAAERAVFPSPNRLTFWAALALLMAGVFLFPRPSAADIYRYVDKDGVAHFTNVPSGAQYKLILKEKRVHFKLSPASLGKFEEAIVKTSEKYGMDSALVKAVIKAESNFNPTAVSRAGAKGLMQLMPGTAYSLQVANSFHPEENIEGGVRYLRSLLNLFEGNLQLALAAYNAGEKAVYRYNGIPPYPETRTYIQRVLHFFHKYSEESGKPGQQSAATN